MAQLFHELILPRHDNAMGEDRKDWCTHDDNDGMFYLLNDGSLTLVHVMGAEVVEDVYFDTEEKCHEHAAAYYKKHDKDYPFMIEWIAVSGIFATDESRVMEFI